MLFTSDEEGAGGCCVANFLDSGVARQFEQVIVAEPTCCKAVLGHRGFLSVKTRFQGIPGHSSEARALQENANHQMARWAAGALQVAEGRKDSEIDPGSCMNIGVVDGGSKSNVIAGSAFVHWSARLQPGESNDEFLREKSRLVPHETLKRGTGKCRSGASHCLQAARTTSQPGGSAMTHELPLGEAVDFWTEASLFSAAGLPALVLGPGDIAQAHVSDEWVELEQLETAYETLQPGGEQRWVKFEAW